MQISLKPSQDSDIREVGRTSQSGFVEVDRTALSGKFAELAKSGLVDIDRTAVAWKLVGIAKSVAVLLDLLVCPAACNLPGI